MSSRKKYFIWFVILFLVEVIIALFIRDNFIRPYIGDILVVFLLYTFIRSIVSRTFKAGTLPICIFLFSVAVELLQYFNIVNLLGLENSRFFSIIIGTVFDIKDIICYGIGCILIFIFELKTIKTP